ncbi:MAG: acylphosphatase [Parachlamydiales bacterium]|nr:acylphosphatase [Parachlamydiales bacterium]
MGEIFELHVIFFGTVQGVFFRSHVKSFANMLQINGYIKNLENGSVELVAQAKKQVLDELLKLILNNPGFGKITKFEKEMKKPQNNYSKFEIKY